MQKVSQIDISKDFTKAAYLRLLEQGNILEAEQAFEQFKPDNLSDQKYLLGMLELAKGNGQQAVSYLKEAIELNPKDKVIFNNAGIAFQRTGDNEAAIEFFEKALSLDTEYESAQYNLACAYLATENREKALKILNHLVNKNTRNSEYLCARADCLRLLNRWPQALRQYRKALKVDENHLRSNMNLSPILLHMGRVEQAIKMAKKALEIDSTKLAAYKHLADALLANEQLDDAMDAYADAFELDKDNDELCIAIAKVWFEVNNPQEAGFWFNRALEINPESLDAKAGIARLEQDFGDNLQAIAFIEPLLEQEPENIELRLTLSDALWDEGDAEAAIAHLKKVLEVQPNRVATHAKIGQLLSSAGDVDAAIEEYKIALSQQKNNIPALSGMANTLRGKLEPEFVQRMEKNLERRKLREGAKASLHNGLGFYYDGNKNYEKAAQHIALANQYHWSSKSKRGWEYENEKQIEHINRLIEFFNQDLFEKVKGWGVESETPVFVVAMPRSGTTLTEQILARHEKVLGIGERNFASQSFLSLVRSPQGEQLERLHEVTQGQLRRIGKRYLGVLEDQKLKAKCSDVLRVVDKMPDNYSLVGWIAMLFPNAKIIHIKRDHRDVALSSWMTQFGAIRWACKEEHLVERFRQYRRIMQHWRETIPGRFIEISYEELVANQEAESKRLIEYIGLDWDEACLKFYESDRLVRTASVTQVRQPIYNKSVAKWKHYEQYFPDLFDPLTEMIEQA